MKKKNTSGRTRTRKLKTGFAAMSKEKRREVARKGGRATARARARRHLSRSSENTEFIPEGRVRITIG